MNEQLRKILEDLKSQEWVHKLARNAELYVVGGSVRDSFLGKELKDIDLVVDGLSFTGIQKILKPYGKQNLVGDSFNVIKFRPEGHVGEDYDIAVPRIDKKVGKGHKGFEIITDGVDIEGDLKRRDFTINSMAVNVMNGKLLDPFKGKLDLTWELIRATDKTAFIEDPLRILRGIQFASRFEFAIEPETLKLMKKNAHLIKEITGERILEEFEKIVNKGNTQIALRLLHQTGIDVALFDKEMLHYDEGFDYLDAISFYYMLGLIGDVDPYTFYMKRLKGNVQIGKGIKVLDDLITKWNRADNDEDKRYLAFDALSKVPQLIDVVLIPIEMDHIIGKMETKEIPMFAKDIPLTGNDIMEMFNVSGEQVGIILERIRRDALMNRFDWHSREDSIEYLSKLKF